MDQDAKKQCGQAVAMTSLVRIKEAEFIALKNAQQADPIPMKFVAPTRCGAATSQAAPMGQR